MEELEVLCLAEKYLQSNRWFTTVYVLREKEEETICFFAKKGNTQKVKELLNSKNSAIYVNYKDDEGRTGTFYSILGSFMKP